MANNHDVLRVRHQYNVNQNRRNRDGANRANNRQQNQVSRLVFNLTPGALLYPGCGLDSFEPIRMFIDSITEFHFIDRERIPPLPLIQTET